MCVNDCTHYIKEVFMINFKRIFAGVMAAATAVSLAACSNSGTSTTASTGSDDSTTST